MAAVETVQHLAPASHHYSRSMAGVTVSTLWLNQISTTLQGGMVQLVSIFLATYFQTCYQFLHWICSEIAWLIFVVKRPPRACVRRFSTSWCRCLLCFCCLFFFISSQWNAILLLSCLHLELLRACTRLLAVRATHAVHMLHKKWHNSKNHCLVWILSAIIPNYPPMWDFNLNVRLGVSSSHLGYLSCSYLFCIVGCCEW